MATDEKKEIRQSAPASLYGAEEFKPEKQRTLSRWWIIFSAVLVLSLGIGFWGHSYFFGAPQPQAELEQFTIPTTTAGDHDKKIIDDSREIAELLKEKGFIKSTLGFNIAFAGRISSRCVDCIGSGAYKISKSMSVFEIARVLKKGPYMKWVVIPEGLRKEQIAELLADTLGWTNQEKSSWVNTYTSMKFDEVEGVYFPDSYLIPVDEGLLQVADRLRGKFNEKFAPYAGETFRQNIRWQTLIRVASLVQREAAGEQDMPLVAGIIWNRLLGKMKLQIDATLQYIRGNEKDGWWPKVGSDDKFIESPYNTYLHEGLPPHPIANPGLSAIKAALFPEETKCLYYLHDASGTIHCAKTYAEHEKNIEEFLR